MAVLGSCLSHNKWEDGQKNFCLLNLKGSCYPLHQYPHYNKQKTSCRNTSEKYCNTIC